MAALTLVQEAVGTLLEAAGPGVSVLQPITYSNARLHDLEAVGASMQLRRLGQPSLGETAKIAAAVSRSNAAHKAADAQLPIPAAPGVLVNGYVREQDVLQQPAYSCPVLLSEGVNSADLHTWGTTDPGRANAVPNGTGSSKILHGVPPEAQVPSTVDVLDKWLKRFEFVRFLVIGDMGAGHSTNPPPPAQQKRMAQRTLLEHMRAGTRDFAIMSFRYARLVLEVVAAAAARGSHIETHALADAALMVRCTVDVDRLQLQLQRADVGVQQAGQGSSRQDAAAQGPAASMTVALELLLCCHPVLFRGFRGPQPQVSISTSLGLLSYKADGRVSPELQAELSRSLRALERIQNPEVDSDDEAGGAGSSSSGKRTVSVALTGMQQMCLLEQRLSQSTADSKQVAELDAAVWGLPGGIDVTSLTIFLATNAVISCPSPVAPPERWVEVLSLPASSESKARLQALQEEAMADLLERGLEPTGWLQGWLVVLGKQLLDAYSANDQPRVTRCLALGRALLAAAGVQEGPDYVAGFREWQQRNRPFFDARTGLTAAVAQQASLLITACAWSLVRRHLVWTWWVHSKEGELKQYVPMLLEHVGLGAPSPGPGAGAGLVHGYSLITAELLTQDLLLPKLVSKSSCYVRVGEGRRHVSIPVLLQKDLKNAAVGPLAPVRLVSVDTGAVMYCKIVALSGGQGKWGLSPATATARIVGVSADVQAELVWDANAWGSAGMPTVELSVGSAAAQSATRAVADHSAASLAAAAAARMVDSDPPEGAQCKEVRVPLGNNRGCSKLDTPTPLLDVPSTFFRVLSGGGLARRVILMYEDDRCAVNMTDYGYYIRLGAGVRPVLHRLLAQGAGPDHTLLLRHYDRDTMTVAGELVPVLRSQLLNEPSGGTRFLLKKHVVQLTKGLQAGAVGTMLREEQIALPFGGIYEQRRSQTLPKTALLTLCLPSPSQEQPLPYFLGVVPDPAIQDSFSVSCAALQLNNAGADGGRVVGKAFCKDLMLRANNLSHQDKQSGGMLLLKRVYFDDNPDIVAICGDVVPFWEDTVSPEGRAAAHGRPSGQPQRTGTVPVDRVKSGSACDFGLPAKAGSASAMVREACASFVTDDDNKLEVLLAVPAAGPPGRHRGFRVRACFDGGAARTVRFTGQTPLIAHLKAFDLSGLGELELASYGDSCMGRPVFWCRVLDDGAEVAPRIHTEDKLSGQGEAGDSQGPGGSQQAGSSQGLVGGAGQGPAGGSRGGKGRGSRGGKGGSTAATAPDPDTQSRVVKLSLRTVETPDAVAGAAVELSQEPLGGLAAAAAAGAGSGGPAAAAAGGCSPIVIDLTASPVEGSPGDEQLDQQQHPSSGGGFGWCADAELLPSSSQGHQQGPRAATGGEDSLSQQQLRAGSVSADGQGVVVHESANSHKEGGFQPDTGGLFAFMDKPEYQQQVASAVPQSPPPATAGTAAAGGCASGSGGEACQRVQQQQEGTAADPLMPPGVPEEPAAAAAAATGGSEDGLAPTQQQLPAVAAAHRKRSLLDAAVQPLACDGLSGRGSAADSHHHHQQQQQGEGGPHKRAKSSLPPPLTIQDGAAGAVPEEGGQQQQQKQKPVGAGLMQTPTLLVAQGRVSTTLRPGRRRRQAYVPPTDVVEPIPFDALPADLQHLMMDRQALASGPLHSPGRKQSPAASVAAAAGAGRAAAGAVDPSQQLGAGGSSAGCTGGDDEDRMLWAQAEEGWFVCGENDKESEEEDADENSSHCKQQRRYP